MKANNAEIKYLINNDLILKSPLYALLILAIWGTISFVMMWVLLNVIKPSIDSKTKTKKEYTLSIKKERSMHLIKHKINVSRNQKR